MEGKDVATRHTTTNFILRSLPVAERERIIPQLERVDLPHGSVLAHPDDKISHVYFPEDAMISVVAYSEEGQGSEIAVIGFEGLTGIEIVLGAERTVHEFVTQLPRTALRMPAKALVDEFHRSKAMQELLLRFAHKMMVQIGQTALCNRLHTTEKRLSRWLLMAHDRHRSNVLNITQEFLAIMLGTSRTSVSLTATELQNQGLIAYSRGVVSILDRKALENYTCSCYRMIRKAYIQEFKGQTGHRR
jgi:CRP-like cAMP-binding protein